MNGKAGNAATRAMRAMPGAPGFLYNPPHKMNRT